VAQRHNRSSEVEPGPTSPELCLVDPELAREARACLPVNTEVERELERTLARRMLRAPVPGRRRASARPVEPRLRVRARSRRRRAAPRVVEAAQHGL
jgi:hypothetical protein